MATRCSPAQTCPFYQLLESAMAQASELFRCDEVLIGLRAAGMEGNRQSVDRLVLHFSEYRERVTEVSGLSPVMTLFSFSEYLYVLSQRGVCVDLFPVILCACVTSE